MAFGDMRRMKALATTVGAVAPGFFDPRIDAFQPAPGIPSASVVLDVWDGEVDVVPGVRLLLWPIGKSWVASRVLFKAGVLDVINIAPYPETGPSDQFAPRWAIGATIWALRDLSGLIQRAYPEVETIEHLPVQAHNAVIRIGRRIVQLEVIHES